MKSLRYYFACTALTILITLVASAQTPAPEPAKVDSFITPHFRIFPEQQITKDAVVKIADNIELIFNTFQSHIQLPLQKNMIVELYSKPGSVARKFNGPPEMTTGISADTLFIQEWESDKPEQQEAITNSLRFLIPYGALKLMSAQGVPSWMIRGYVLWYMNAPLKEAPISTLIGSFDDFPEEENSIQNQTQMNDYDFLVTKTVGYLIKKYGESKYLSVFTMLTADKTLEDVFEKVFGEKYNVIERGWRSYIESQLSKGPTKKE